MCIVYGEDMQCQVNVCTLLIHMYVIENNLPRHLYAVAISIVTILIATIANYLVICMVSRDFVVCSCVKISARTKDQKHGQPFFSRWHTL